MKPIFLLDNFDSFTYNLVDQFRCLGHEVHIYRNNVSADTIIAQMKKCADSPILVLSPGPSSPSDAGCLLELIRKCVGKYPILGICLGHQAICQYYGATIAPANEIVHGKTSLIEHVHNSLFTDFPNPLPVARYHSLIATHIPQSLEVIAHYNGIAMAVMNRADRVIGYQFHPESIMTTYGATLLQRSIEFLTKPVVDVKALVNKLYANEDLTKDESCDLFNSIFAEEVSPVQLGSILTALKMKGEKPAEIAGAAKAMLTVAGHFELKRDFLVGEVVGTGGDNQSTINISTISSIVAATCGLHIAKHGNRSVSSMTGASDLLKALGVNINMDADTSFQCLKSAGVTFLFAQLYHPAMRFAGPVRSALGVRTIFNVLGTLTNPAHPDYILMGVYDKKLLLPLTEVLRSNGMKRAMVVHGSGLDEIALHGPTDVMELHDNGEITSRTITPADFGLDTYPLSAIRGGMPTENKEITLKILQGHGTAAQTASIAANTAALLVLGGVCPDLKAGAKLALDTIQSGKAYHKLQEFIELSNIDN